MRVNKAPDTVVQVAMFQRAATAAGICPSRYEALVLDAADSAGNPLEGACCWHRYCCIPLLALCAAKTITKTSKGFCSVLLTMTHLCMLRACLPVCM